MPKMPILSCYVRFVDTCMQFAREGLNDEEAVEKATCVLEISKEETTSAHSKRVC